MTNQKLQYTDLAQNGLAINETESSPLDCEDEFIQHKQRWALLLRFEDGNLKYFKRRGEAGEFRYRLAGSNTVFSPDGGRYLDVCVERFLPALAFDAVSRKQVPIRRRIVTHNTEGEPCFPIATTAAAQFCADYTPESAWMTALEWDAMLAELSPLIEAEKAIKWAENIAIAERNRLAEERARAAASPTSELARGISEGVAQALKSLGLAGKEKP